MLNVKKLVSAVWVYFCKPEITCKVRLIFYWLDERFDKLDMDINVEGERTTKVVCRF